MRVMRFIDSSVFLYAFLKPKRRLEPGLLELKQRAKEIIKRVNDGEKVVTTVVHLSEVANILEARENLERATQIVKGLLSKGSIKILGVSRGMYEKAVELAMERGLGINDSLAVLVMEKLGLREIYSFDRDFDKVGGIKRLVE